MILAEVVGNLSRCESSPLFNSGESHMALSIRQKLAACLGAILALVNERFRAIDASGHDNVITLHYHQRRE
jgi:hypothetical protein